MADQTYRSDDDRHYAASAVRRTVDAAEERGRQEGVMLACKELCIGCKRERPLQYDSGLAQDVHVAEDGMKSPCDARVIRRLLPTKEGKGDG